MSLSINLIEKNHFWQLTSTLIALGSRICEFPIKGFMCFVRLFVTKILKSITFIFYIMSIMKIYTFIRRTEFLMTNFLTQALTWIATIVRVDCRFISV